eukprot:gene28481-34379_t
MRRIHFSDKLRFIIVWILLAFLFLDPKWSIASESSGKIKSCQLVSLQAQRFAINCWKAEFSQYSSPLYGKLVYEPSGLCEITRHEKTCSASPSPLIALTSRGNCTFSAKAQNAHAKGYVALVVFNTNASMYTIGSTTANYVSPLPVYAIGGNSLAPLVPSHISYESWADSVEAALGAHQDVYLSVREVEDKRERAERYTQHSQDVDVIVHKKNNTEIKDEDSNRDKRSKDHLASSEIPVTAREGNYLSSLFPGLLHILLPVVFVAMRLSTLRRLEIDAQDEKFTRIMRDFNHKETDELIYEAILEQTLDSPWTYSLPLYTQHHLHLPAQNYHPSLFHHPPLFIYTCRFLLSLFPSLPLPLLPVVFQSATLIILPLLTREILKHDDPLPSSGRSFSQSILLFPSLVYLTCPLTLFTSQRVWLDTLSPLTAVLAVYLHLVCMRWIKYTRAAASHYSHVRTACLCIAAGLAFSLLCLLTKLPLLAFLPPLAIHTFLEVRRVGHVSYTVAGMHTLLYLGAVVCGHAPWVFVYYVHTGRIIPSAMPSAELVASFPMLQRALSLSPLHYLYTLFSLHPAYLIAVPLLGIVGWGRAVGLIGGMVLCFSGGMMLVACVGGGVQMRFLLPILPFMSILSGMGAMHCAYYLISTPLWGDISLNIFDVIKGMVSNKLTGGLTQEEAEAVKNKGGWREGSSANNNDQIFFPPLPDPVVNLLRCSKLCFLATQNDGEPHLSLMNFTYDRPTESIILCTRRNTKKFAQIASNRKVALLIHDFPHLDLANSEGHGRSWSMTLNGVCKIWDEGDKEGEALRAIHLNNNPDYAQFISGAEIAVMQVGIEKVRMCDINDKVSYWNNKHGYGIDVWTEQLQILTDVIADMFLKEFMDPPDAQVSLSKAVDILAVYCWIGQTEVVAVLFKDTLTVHHYDLPSAPA